MKKETQNQIKKWCKDFEKTQPNNVMIDNDTFEGSAYDLLSKALTEQEQTQKKAIEFLKLIVKGIRGEYEQGWSHRNDEKDIQTFTNILN